MDQAMSRDKIDISDRQLACARIQSAEGQEYLAGMAAAANFAFVNRAVLAHQTRKVGITADGHLATTLVVVPGLQAFAKIFESDPADLDMHLVYDVCHNIAKVEEHVLLASLVVVAWWLAVAMVW